MIDSASERSGFWMNGADGALTVATLAARNWAVRATCAACGQRRMWYVRDLMASFPPAAPIAAIAARLVCGGCGSRDGWVQYLQDTGAGAKRNALRHAAECAARDEALDRNAKSAPRPEPGGAVG